MRWSSFIVGSAAFVACTGGSGITDAGSDGGNQMTPLATALLTETNGAAAAKAYTDHVPTAAEANEVGAFLAYVAEAQQTGGLDEGLLSSSLLSEVRAIALEYPDFFVATADGGIAPKTRFIDGASQIACGVSCEPSATAFTSAIDGAIPAIVSSLDPQATSIAQELGQAAQALETSGSPQGQAFNDAISSADGGEIDSFLSSFVQDELQPGDLTAAESLLGLSSAQVQQLDNAVASVWAGLITSIADNALEAAAQLEQQCVAYQTQNCSLGSTTTSTASGTTSGAVTGTTSGATTGSPVGSNTGATSGATSVSSGGSGTSSSSSGTTSGTGVGTSASSTSSSGTGSGGSTTSGGPASPYLLDRETVFLINLVHDSHGNQLGTWVTESKDGGCPEGLATAFYNADAGTWSPLELPPEEASCVDISVGAGSTLSDNGDALVAWWGSADAGGQSVTALGANHYDHSSGSWDGPHILAVTSSYDREYNLQVTMGGLQSAALNSQGDGWVLYSDGEQDCGVNTEPFIQVYAVPYTLGTGFGAPVAIGPYACSQCTSTWNWLRGPQAIVALADDTFVAAWGQDETAGNPCSNAYSSVLGGARASGAGWSAPLAVSAGPDSVGETNLAWLTAGDTNALASWYWDAQLDGGTLFIQYGLTGLQASDSAWETPQLLSTDYSLNSGVLGPDGAGFVGYQAGVDGGHSPDLWVAPLTSTLVMGPPVDLSSRCALASGGGKSSLAINSAGETAAVWQATSSGDLLGAVYAPASGWGTCESIGVPYPVGVSGIVADIGDGHWGTLYDYSGDLYFEDLP